MPIAKFGLGLSCTPEIAAAGCYPVPEKSRGFHRRPSGYVALHHHTYHGTLHIGGKHFELQLGDMALTPAHTESLYDVSGGGFHLCVYYRSEDVDATLFGEERYALD